MLGRIISPESAGISGQRGDKARIEARAFLLDVRAEIPLDGDHASGAAANLGG
jgi:hypothetical protein